MAAKTSIYYDIISEYNNKGEKAAETGLAKLNKSALSLAKTYGFAFSGAALVAFGVKAVKAAAAEDKAFVVLGNTLKNLGLGFEALNSKHFIENLALSTGVTIDTLIPAYQQLLVATGDVALSQKDLAIAMDVSAATGKDLAAVTTAISKAYLGNTTALSRLGAGLDKSLLKTGDMNKIMQKLSDTFKGTAATAADTTAGAMARVAEATHLATVAVGEGLISAFDQLTSGNSVKGATDNIVGFGTAIGQAITGIGVLIGKIQKLVYLGPILGPIFKQLGWSLTHSVGALALKGLEKLGQTKADVISPTVLGAIAQGNAQAQAKVTAQKLAEAKSTATILANTKKTTAELKAQAALKALGNPADDLAKAELIAALQKDVSAEAKLQLQYQLDLLNLQNLSGDALQKASDQALYLKEQVLAAYGLIQLANGAVVNFATAKNPFEGFDVTLTALLKALYGVNDIMVTIGQSITKANGAALGLSQSLLDRYAGTYQPPVGGTDGIAPYASSNTFTYPSAPPSGLSAADLYSSNVNLNISLDQGLIVSTTNAASAAGSQITINRNQNQFV